MIEDLLQNYLPIFIFLVISCAVSCVLILLPLLIGAIRNEKPSAQKLSQYECGFHAFEDSRVQFDIKFYLVSILFIIFDLEIAFLFPWALALRDIGLFGFCSMMIFLGVLTVGFIYEWKRGALEWK